MHCTSPARVRHHIPFILHFRRIVQHRSILAIIYNMPRQARDPFTDATLHFSTANVPCMRSQTSQQSIRSNTATGPSRPRQQRDLFAPALSRRPTNRSTPCIEDDVLADPDSEQEAAGIRAHRQIRSTRQGSPECKYGRTKPRPIEEVEFVNRQPNGNYLLAADEIDKALASQEVLPELQAEASIAGWW